MINASHDSQCFRIDIKETKQRCCLCSLPMASRRRLCHALPYWPWPIPGAIIPGVLCTMKILDDKVTHHVLFFFCNFFIHFSCESNLFLFVYVQLFSLGRMLLPSFVFPFIVGWSVYSVDSKTLTSILTSTSTVVVPSSTKIPSSYNSDSDFQSSILNSTNHYRKQHNATQVKWNETLAVYARTYAAKCLWNHSVIPSFFSPPF